MSSNKSVEFPEDNFYDIDLEDQTTTTLPTKTHPPIRKPFRKPLLRVIRDGIPFGTRTPSPPLLPIHIREKRYLENDFEEQRYGQKIDSNFFCKNTGHGVFSTNVSNTSTNEASTSSVKNTNLTAHQIQVATNSAIEDFRIDFSEMIRRERELLCRERDCNDKYNITETIETGSEFYRNNANLFNV